MPTGEMVSAAYLATTVSFSRCRFLNYSEIQRPSVYFVVFQCFLNNEMNVACI